MLGGKLLDPIISNQETADERVDPLDHSEANEAVDIQAEANEAADIQGEANEAADIQGEAKEAADNGDAPKFCCAGHTAPL